MFSFVLSQNDKMMFKKRRRNYSACWTNEIAGWCIAWLAMCTNFETYAHLKLMCAASFFVFGASELRYIAHNSSFCFVFCSLSCTNRITATPKISRSKFFCYKLRRSFSTFNDKPPNERQQTLQFFFAFHTAK